MEQRGDESYSKSVRAKWFCCALKLSFLQLICKASLTSKSNLKFTLLIVLLRLLMALRKNLLRIDKAFETFGSLKIRNFGYTQSWLQLLRKSMSSLSLFFLYANFSYFRKSLTVNKCNKELQCLKRTQSIGNLFDPNSYLLLTSAFLIDL